MGNYKTCEMTRFGMKVTLQIPERSVEDERARQDVKKMMAMLLREQMQESLSERGGS